LLSGRSSARLLRQDVDLGQLFKFGITNFTTGSRDGHRRGVNDSPQIGGGRTAAQNWYATARHELCGTRRKAYAGFWSISKKDGTTPPWSICLAYARSALALLLLNELDAIAAERVGRGG
jgi:hypothetical protein